MLQVRDHLFPEAWAAGVVAAQRGEATPEPCGADEYGTPRTVFNSGFGSCTHTHTLTHTRTSTHTEQTQSTYIAHTQRTHITHTQHIYSHTGP